MNTVSRIIVVVSFVGACECEALSQDTTARPPLVKGGIYDRPYLVGPSSRIALGGSAETMARSA